MDDVIRELVPEAIIVAGGWNPAYARVLLVEHDGDTAVVLVDGNGDGAELEVEFWHRDENGLWHGGSSSGYGPLDYMSSAQSWNAGDFVVALGRVQPGAEISVEYDGRVCFRRASEYGTWGFVHAADAAGSGDLPRVTAVAPPE